MNGITLLLINLLTTIQVQTSDSLINVPNLEAFTHADFLFSEECDCSRYNFDYIYLPLYSEPTDSLPTYSVIPANFDVGHRITIIGKQGDFFKIIIEEGTPHDFEQQLVGKELFVKKGSLATWLIRYNGNTHDYISVPLYAEPSLNSKIIEQVAPENSIARILDIKDGWMYVEPIIKGAEKQRGWLDPKSQLGNPYGIDCDPYDYTVYE